MIGGDGIADVRVGREDGAGSEEAATWGAPVTPDELSGGRVVNIQLPRLV